MQEEVEDHPVWMKEPAKKFGYFHMSPLVPPIRVTPESRKIQSDQSLSHLRKYQSSHQ